MIYKNFDEWIKSQTHQAHKVVERRVENEDDKEILEDTLVWCEREIEQNHKMLKRLEDAAKEVCSKEQYEQIQKLYTVFIHNDFITNSPLGKEMYEKGQIDAASIKFIANIDDEAQ